MTNRNYDTISVRIRIKFIVDFEYSLSQGNHSEILEYGSEKYILLICQNQFIYGERMIQTMAPSTTELSESIRLWVKG